MSNLKRYLVIGISVYFFELLVIVIAQALGASSVWAVAIAFWLGLFVSFGLQKVATFGDKRLHYQVLLPQFLAFCLLVLFNFSFTILFTRLFEDSLPAVWCRTIALAITTVWNFYLYKTKIFNWQKPTKRKKSALARRVQKERKQAIKRYRKWRSKPRIKRVKKYANRPEVSKVFLYASILVLFATTLLWTVLGAHLQQANADQLVNARLFDTSATLHSAVFPDQHSFLIKWPLFYLIKVFDYAPAAYLVVTAFSVFATVVAFVYLLWRIERRPLVLGSLCLALASVLLLVPSQPYAGALLPVNMAMLATRNLEYVLYIAALAGLVKSIRLRSKEFIGSAVLLALLIASDKLFLSISTGGALLAVLAYVLYKRWELAGLAARWLLITGFAGLLAALLMALIEQTGITTIAGGQAGPYGLVQDAKSAALGVVFALSGLFTNFGANPAYDATTLAQTPRSLWEHLFSPAGPAYLLNLLMLIGGLLISGRLLWSSLREKKVETPPVTRISILLLWSSMAAMGLFIVADHYHQVDARYLTLCMLALFVTIAGWLRPRKVDVELAAVAVPVLLFAIVCGIVGNIQTYNGQKQALEGIERRNKVVAQTLASHQAKVLVGDYWRVFPIQAQSAQRAQNVLPLQDCAQPRTALSSKQWEPDLRRTSFAYLLSFDKALTDYPQCSLEDVVRAYGVPNSSALIDGSLTNPKELLLFYDRGTHFPKMTPDAAAAAEVILPISLSDLPGKDCSSPTTMNIVAHQDDDLLFMNPDLQHSIAAGNCIRTIYLTAGDAGGPRPYWLSREQGSEAAYSEMTGLQGAWMDHTVKLPGGQFVTVANMRGNSKISLIFMHLPDGNIDGRGFGASHHESLAGLEAGRVDKLQTVERQSAYTSRQLADALTALMRAYRPSEIRTQSSYLGEVYRDHSDHRTTGSFAVQAYSQYGDGAIPFTFYLGYPIHEFAPNVEGQDLIDKAAAFSAYAESDKGVCRTFESCRQGSVYGIYLERQYRSTY